jgi:hypothetical protein
MKPLGKQPATHDHRDLLFESYVRPDGLPARPATFGHDTSIADWQMLGNDRYGDCVFAGAAHETMLWTAAHGQPVTFDDHHVLDDYSAVTGFRPADPSTDQGTQVRDALSYRRMTGIADAHGQRHKIGAYVALEPGNVDHLLEAAYLFGAVGIGIQFPSSAMTQFDQGRPWSVVAGAKIDGGHYVPLVGVHHRYLEVVTWGRVQRVTRGFLAKYMDESWGILSEEYLAIGKSPEGFNLDQLVRDLQALGH